MKKRMLKRKVKAMMILNSKTSVQRKLSQIVFVRKMMLFENRWKNVIYAILDKMYSAAARSIERGDPTPEDMVDDYINEFVKTSKKWLDDIAWEFAQEAWKDAGVEKGISPFLVKGSILDAFYAWIQIWGEKRAGQMVSQVTDTTKKKIRNALSKGMMENQTRAEISKKLIASGKEINKARALRIAKTETHIAAMGGYHHGMESTKLQMKKEWFAARDARVRMWHAKVSGTVIGMDEEFIVGPDAMMYPGDETASAGNLANCRCVALYHVI